MRFHLHLAHDRVRIPPKSVKNSDENIPDNFLSCTLP